MRNFTTKFHIPLWGIVYLISKGKGGTCEHLRVRKIYYKYVPLIFREVKNCNKELYIPIMRSSSKEGLGIKSRVYKMWNRIEGVETMPRN